MDSGAFQSLALRASLQASKQLDNDGLTPLIANTVDQQQGGTIPAPAVVASESAIVAARMAARISFLIKSHLLCGADRALSKSENERSMG